MNKIHFNPHKKFLNLTPFEKSWQDYFRGSWVKNWKFCLKFFWSNLKPKSWSLIKYGPNHHSQQGSLQVILCQISAISFQLTQNMITNYLLNYISIQCIKLFCSKQSRVKFEVLSTYYKYNNVMLNFGSINR